MPNGNDPTTIEVGNRLKNQLEALSISFMSLREVWETILEEAERLKFNKITEAGKHEDR